MTELLYNADAYISEFEAIVLSSDKVSYNKQDAYDIVLDRTCFFPEQGGQTSDDGILYPIDDDNEIKVVHVSIKEGIIHHICNASLPTGATVKGKIDFVKRFDKMQQHSGEHLVSGTVHSMKGYDNVGFHLSDREVTLDFNGTFTPYEIIQIEETVNKAVYQNFESHVYFPSSEELAELQYRSKLQLTSDVRIVEFPGVDICACCAPHVRRTGEIGMVKITAYEHFRGGTRIWIKCGGRALDAFSSLLNDARTISRLTSSKIEDLSSVVSKQLDDYKQLKYSYIALEKKYLTSVTDEVRNCTNPLIFLDSCDNNNIREALNSMITDKVANHIYCAAFIGNDSDGYRYIIASRVKSCRELFKQMESRFNIKGGGKDDMIQGTIITSEEEIRAYWTNIEVNI